MTAGVVSTFSVQFVTQLFVRILSWTLKSVQNKWIFDAISLSVLELSVLNQEGSL